MSVLEPVVRTARPVHPTPEVLASRPALGGAARGAVQLARHLDVATSRRTDRASSSSSGSRSGAAAPSALPWGVWPTADEAEADDQAAVLGDALASYARMLRAKRAEPAPPPARGIPLVVRRAGGTVGGPRRGPGGLVRSMVPVDQPVAAPVPERPSARPQPLSGRPAVASGRPAATPRPTLTPRRPGGR